MCKYRISALWLVAALLAACGSTPTPRAATIAPRTVAPSSTATLTPPTPMAGCVSAKTLRVRVEPNTHSNIVGGLMEGDCVSIYGTNPDGTWASISNNQLAGWVSIQYLEVSDDTAALPIVGEPPVRSQVPPLPTATSTHKPSFPAPAVAPRGTNTSAPASANALRCTDTSSHIGERVSCTMQRPSCAYHPEIKGSPTFCNEPPYPNHQFTLLVWGQDWSDLNGQCVTVSGLVINYQGKPEIEALSRSQVSRCQ